MAQPVWVLSVDLQTKTATFQTGMQEAARSARQAFGQISSGAGEMGEGVAKGSIDVRHSLGLVDNVIRGAHAQAMADLVRMYAQSAIVMTALPVAATVAGFALIGGIVFEVFQKMKEAKEAQEKLNNAVTEFGTAANNAFGSLDTQILQAQQRSDELRNDHLGALHVQLELIDHQSMQELVKELETVAKAADEVFKQLQGHWYTFGSGSAGASHALQQFKIQYDNLLSQGKDKEAGDLLHGTLSSAQEILKLQQTIQANPAGGGLFGATQGDAQARFAAQTRLHELKVGYTKDEIEAQSQLVTALQAQVTIEGKIAELKKLDGDNAKTGTGNEMAALRAQGQRAMAESQLRMGQSAIAGDKATADARLTIARASVAERLQSDMDFADRDLAVQLAANQAEIAALDKSGKDYANQLAALNNKTLELQQAHETAVADLKAKAAVEQAAKDLQTVEQSEREKIEATQQGSAARLAAVNAAIAEEESRNLQDTNFYRELLNQRVQVTREMLTEESRQKAEAGKEEADHTAKMAELALAAAKEHQQLLDGAKRMTDQQRVTEETAQANALYSIQLAALQKQIDALDKNGKDYQTKLKALQDKETEMTQEHENQITAIKDKAEMDRVTQYARTMSQMETTAAQGFVSILMGHRSFTAEMSSLANTLTNNLLQAGIQRLNGLNNEKLGDAKIAAANVYAEVSGWPGVGPFLAPELAAGAFAAVMAFEGGGIVPGVGRGDIVPAMLTPGEGVVPKGVMEGLGNVARNGGFDQGRPMTHVHYAPTFHVQTIDGDGVRGVLNKHADQFQRHFEGTLRRMNK